MLISLDTISAQCIHVHNVRLHNFSKHFCPCLLDTQMLVHMNWTIISSVCVFMCNIRVSLCCKRQMFVINWILFETISSISHSTSFWIERVCVSLVHICYRIKQTANERCLYVVLFCDFILTPFILLVCNCKSAIVNGSALAIAYWCYDKRANKWSSIFQSKQLLE